jgi:alanyl-tRNA synthetase
MVDSNISLEHFKISESSSNKSKLLIIIFFRLRKARSELLGENLIKKQKINLGQSMRTVISEMGGKGGGRKDNFQGFLPFPEGERGEFQQKVNINLQSYLSKVVQE